MTHPDAARLAFALGPAGPLPCAPDDLLTTLERLWPQRERWAAWRAHNGPQQLLEASSRQLLVLEAIGAKVVFFQDAGFPGSLRRLPAPPAALFYRGDLGLLSDAEQCVAIVGSRAAFRRELQMAAEVAGEAVALGRTVVSGGAIGIDTAAHRGALDRGGKTAVIMGSGLDELYPPRNRKLFAEVAERQGLLLSPFAPGTPPRRGNFPARNALVAAVSSLVVVVAAAARSGALSTARHAIKLGAPVAALPGTAGCDALLARSQASAVRQSEDLAALLAGEQKVAAAIESSSAAELIGALSEGGCSAPDLSIILRRPLAEVTSTLLDLELDGRVIRGPGGKYRPL